jgi:hypothetical protein
MPFSSRVRSGLSPVFMATNVLIWISALIVMGILAYWFSQQNAQPDSIIFMLVVVREPPSTSPSTPQLLDPRLLTDTRRCSRS